ncbi:hypothetical protein Fmac_032972 [Flemingia macrophylla]|uniref:Uncharacterized protein n=1 Tax=Flemingia macrophylla TaxID=520843 RepID=A0ABD1L6H3_9FABA
MTRVAPPPPLLLPDLFCHLLLLLPSLALASTSSNYRGLFSLPFPLQLGSNTFTSSDSSSLFLPSSRSSSLSPASFSLTVPPSTSSPLPSTSTPGASSMPTSSCGMRSKLNRKSARCKISNQNHLYPQTSPNIQQKISSSFGWRVPTESDDGGDGNKSKNSVETRRTSRHWTWEPLVSESLILSLLDPHDVLSLLKVSVNIKVSGEVFKLYKGLKVETSLSYNQHLTHHYGVMSLRQYLIFVPIPNLDAMILIFFPDLNNNIELKLSKPDIDMPNVDSEIIVGKRSTESVIILSDDEVEPKVSSKKDILSVSEAGQHISHGNIMPHDVGNSLPTADLANLNVSVMKNSKTMKESIQKKASSSNLHDKSGATSFIDAKDLGSCRKEVSSKSKAINSDEAVNARNLNKAYSNMTPKNGDTVPSTCNKMSCDIQDAEDDPLEIALKSVGHVQLHVPKPTVLKRQVIQLKTPFNKYGYLRKLEDPMKRFRPPSLDNWYKAILVINYFATVRLSSFRKD